MHSTLSRDVLIDPLTPTAQRIEGTEALTAPELLSAILDHATRQTLVSAARVSRAWSYIALDNLWSGHDIKIIDLLKILPLESVEVPDTSSRFWKLQRNPTDNEWTRLYSYASWVRSLSVPGPEPDGFDQSITKWKVGNDVLFPRLRRIEWHFPERYAMPFSQLRSFITPGLQELCLNTEYVTAMAEEGPSFFHDLATIEGLRMKKLKVDYPYISADSEFGLAVANLVAASGDSIQALELGLSDLIIPSMVGHSLRNLKALDFWVQLSRGVQPIQVLVEGCPHIAYFRIGMRPVRNKVDLLNIPGVRAILGWSLLSFEVRLMRNVRVGKTDIEEMSKAWPKLKKLNLNWKKGSSDNYLPLSCLVDIGAAFPELEDLGALFSYDADSEPFLPTNQLPSVLHRPSRLWKLRLGGTFLPERHDQRNRMARLFADILTPGLCVERICPIGSDGDLVLLQEREKIGRDVDPEWDALFQQIEELHGGVRIWVGSIPEDGDGVWF